MEHGQLFRSTCLREFIEMLSKKAAALFKGIQKFTGRVLKESRGPCEIACDSLMQENQALMRRDLRKRI